MNIHAVLIDDEKHNLENLSQLLKEYCREVIVTATATNAEQGKMAIENFKPELVFLDIQMPGKNGFDLLQSLPNYDFEVIFVTAYDKYGIQAVKFAAVDYLLKPINIEELKAAVGRAQKKCTSKKQNLQLENLVHLLQHNQNKSEHRLALTTLKETRFVKTNQVIYCESSNNYTTFYLESKEKLLVSKPIYEYENLLEDYGFVRCHQSFLVNIKYIKSLFKEDGGFLLLETGMQIPVSKSKKEIVLRALEKN